MLEIPMLGRRPSRVRGSLVVLVTLVAAAGVALIVVGLGPMGWGAIIPGACMLLISIPTIFVLERGEIEEAAKRTGRSRAVTLRADIRRPSRASFM
jgi:hypothetical protein